MSNLNAEKALIRQQLQLVLPHLNAGMTVLLIGGGAGEIALCLGEIDESIKVISVDSDREQAKLAAANLAEVDNCISVHDEHYGLSSVEDKVDLAVAHDVLLRVQDPESVLSSVFKRLQSGGRLLIREGLSGADYYRQFPLGNKYQNLHDLLTRVHSALGDSPAVGVELKSCLNRAGFAAPQIRVDSQVYDQPEHMQMLQNWYLQRFSDEFSNAAVAAGIVTREELQTLLASLHTIAEDPGALVILNWITYIVSKPHTATHPH